MAEWISVKERLPDKEGKYLCYCDYGCSGAISVYSFAKNLSKVDKYDFRGEKRAGWYFYDSEWGYGETESVTHWMPLPEPPKERGGSE